MSIRFTPLMSLALIVSATPAIAAPAASQCPGATFDAFLYAFAESGAVQQANTAVPLVLRSIDSEAEPEPQPVTKTLGAGEVRFPIMPDSADRQRENMTLAATRKAGGVMQVKLSEADTGYQVFYTFRPQGSCWSLVEVDNQSL